MTQYPAASRFTCKLSAYRVARSSRAMTDIDGIDDNAKSSIKTRRVHAPCQHSHRRLALSRRLAGCQLQFRAYQATDPEARSRKIRRLLHGGSSGRAQHADRCTEAQP